MSQRAAQLIASILALSGLVVSTAACAGRPTIEPPTELPPKPSEPVTHGSEGGAPFIAPPALERPADVACYFSGYARNEVSLRTRPSGPAFAIFSSKMMSVSVPAGKASHAIVDITDAALVLRGAVAPADIDLRPAKSFVMNEFLVPAWSPLSWIEGAHERLTVTLTPPSAILPAKPLAAQVACDDVRLYGGPGDPLAPGSALFADKPGTVMRLRSGMDVALSSAIDGPPVATLRIPDGNPIVFISESRGQRYRIGWDLGELYVFGWVDKAALMRPPSLSGSHRTRPPMISSPRHIDQPTVDYVWCMSDIPLIAEAGGERVTVGTIRGESAITIVQWGKDISRIWWQRPSWMEDGFHAPSDWLIPADDAAFFGLTRDLRSCVSLVKPDPR